MTVLASPVTLMLDNDSVAAFLSRDSSLSCHANRNVLDAIPDRNNAAGGRGKHVHTALLDLKIGKPDIGPIVAVIGAAATLKIANLAGSIVVNVVLDKAGNAELAFYRKRQNESLRGLGFGNEGQVQKQESRKFTAQRCCPSPHAKSISLAFNQCAWCCSGRFATRKYFVVAGEKIGDREFIRE